MNLKEMREAALKALSDIQAKMKAENRGPSTDEATEIEAKTAEVADLTKRIDAAAEGERLLAAFGSKAPEAPAAKPGDAEAKSYGDAFVKSDNYKRIADGQYGMRTQVKANTDVHSLAELDGIHDSTRKLATLRQPEGDLLSIFNWLHPEPIGEGAVKWVEETLDEGQFKIVAPGEMKPQLHFGYEPKSDTLHTAAGWFDSHVSLVRRAPQFAADINRRGIRRLLLDQERLIMTASASTDGFDGLLNSSGVGTVTAASQGEWFDKIDEAIEQAEQLGDFPVDGIVMSRADWGTIRRSKDHEGQYLSGGPFGASVAQRLWQVPVFVSPYLTKGTALVGASQNIGVWTEPTIHVDVTNSDGDKFRRNIVTTRIEQDILAAWLRPAGGVKVTLTA